MQYLVATFNITCNEELFETACDLLVASAGEVGFESFESNENIILGYIQIQNFCKEKLDEELESIPLENLRISYNIETVENINWNEIWEDNGFQPIIIDNNCVIYDAKHTDKDAVDSSYNMNVFIEAKQAFGTGTHQTTRMVVSEILKHDISGCNFLDCGCGTGILGIVASKKGAHRVLGYDIDEWSVNNAKHNAKLNNIDNMEVILGDIEILKQYQESFNMVAANINRNILLTDLPQITKKTKESGLILLSGFYKSDVDIIIKKANELGLKEDKIIYEDDWACIVLIKNSHHITS